MGEHHFLTLRCTLAVFERSYQVRILPYKLNKGIGTITHKIITYQSSLDPYAQTNQIRFISEVASAVQKFNDSPNPWFIAGFVDVEGCFSIIISKNNKIKTG